LQWLLCLSGGIIERKDNVRDGLILPDNLTLDGRSMLVHHGTVSEASKGYQQRLTKQKKPGQL
jgi:hypothetical protein